MALIYIALGWSAGLYVARTSAPLSSGMWLILAAFMLVMVALNWRSPFRLWNIVVLFFVLGAGRYAMLPTTADTAAFNNSGGLTITGVVTAEPDVRDNQTLLRVKTESVTQQGETRDISGDVLVRASRALDVAYGDRVAATGDLITPGEFDTYSYSEYLAARGIFSVMDHTSVAVISGGHGNAIQATLIDLRGRAQDWVNRHLPEPQAGLLNGILTGNERGISPEVDAAFQTAGAAHVIAISGFNMAIIAAVVSGLLQQAFPARRGWAATLAVSVVLVYAMFAGGNAAVMRAAFMSSLLIVGEALRRKTYVPVSLALSALVMSLLDPNVLWDVGFQLSFMAVLGLALFTDPIGAAFDRTLARLFPAGAAGRVGAFLQEPLVVSLAAQIAVTPLILLYFERFSAVVLLVNLLIVPVQAYLLVIGALALLTFWFEPLSQALFWLDMVLLTWTIDVVRWFAALPFAEAVVWIHPRWIALVYIVLIGWTMLEASQPRWYAKIKHWVRSRLVASATSFAGAACAILLVSIAINRPDGQLNVWFLDVGHSNGVLIESPGGAQVLVDGGRFPSRLLTQIGDRIPFTDTTLELVIITQPDPLDMGALDAVLERYDVKSAIINGQPNLNDDYITILDALNAEADVVSARAGQTITFDDGLQIEVLHPFDVPELEDSVNDGALLLRLTYGDVSFLLPGDLSAEGQATLLENGYWPHATVLQVPAHGGRNALSRDFLAAVSPSAAVISVDPANRRGDPDDGTLELLSDVPLYRTDTSGVIHMWTDGTDLWVGE